MNLGTSFTTECYFKAEPIYSASVFWGLTDASGHGIGVNIAEEAGDQVYIHLGFNGFATYSNITSAIHINEWQHLAIVKEPGIYSVYIDSQLVASGGVSGSGNDPVVIYPGWPGDRTIGGESGTWRGWLDEIRFSDEALTPDQFLNAVPEPSTIILLMAGVVALVLARRKGQ